MTKHIQVIKDPKDDILKMKPGVELNTQVAEKVLGNSTAEDATWGYMERFIDPADGAPLWVPLTPYSEEVAAAESVVQAMLEMGYADAIYWSDYGNGNNTKAEAICKAALLAIAEAPVACCQKHWVGKAAPLASMAGGAFGVDELTRT